MGIGGHALLKLQPWACSSALPRSIPLLPQKDTQIPLAVTALLLLLPALPQANSLCPLVPGKIVFLMETGAAPCFMCYFISPLFFHEYRLMVVLAWALLRAGDLGWAP